MAALFQAESRDPWQSGGRGEEVGAGGNLIHALVGSGTEPPYLQIKSLGFDHFVGSLPTDSSLLNK